MRGKIRQAIADDAARIVGIYASFCADSYVSFETEAPEVAEMAGRIARITRRFPWLVYERDGLIDGYAYASPHRDRAAYRWSVDVAIYIGEGQRGKKLGRALYQALFEMLAAQGFCNAYAGIALPNPASVRLHESLGFEPVGVYRSVGYKHGEWRNVGWWARRLAEYATPPGEPIAVNALDAVIWRRIVDAAEGLEDESGLLRSSRQNSGGH